MLLYALEMCCVGAGGGHMEKERIILVKEIVCDVHA